MKHKLTNQHPLLFELTGEFHAQELLQRAKKLAKEGILEAKKGLDQLDCSRVGVISIEEAREQTDRVVALHLHIHYCEQKLQEIDTMMERLLHLHN